MLIESLPSSPRFSATPALVTPTGNEQEQAQQVEAEQVRLIVTHAMTGFVIGLLTVGMMVVVLWPVVAPRVLLGWVLLMGTLTLPVFVMVLRFRRESPSLAHIRAWVRWFTLGYGLSGCGWGLGGVLLFPAHSLAHQLFLVFIIGGHAAGGMTSLSSVPSVLLTFLCAMLTPIVMRLCWLGDPVLTAMGIMLAIFGVAMFVIGRHLHAVLAENLRLRFANIELVQDLSLAKDRAESANRAKSQFLANMSHELRTPMNGVLGMIEVLSQTAMTDRQRQLVYTAQRSGQNLLVIIEDLLDLSRIEAGKLALEALEFQLREFLDETLALFTESTARKGVTLTCLVHDEVPLFVCGDPIRLRQILVNLVGNAVKFTDHGAIVVQVRRSTFDVQGQERGATHLNLGSETLRLYFSVRDSGVGIPQEAQARIFEVFSQADNSTTRKYGGAGLGLNIAQQLVQLMGGEIGVESTVGAGSTFWFTVELRPVDIPSRVTALLPLTHRDYAAFRFTEDVTGAPEVLWPINVLLAEDDPVNQQVARSMLETLGCRVDIVGEGSQVLQAMTRCSYDVVFVDCHMPTMDGFEAARAVRLWEAERNTPSVVSDNAHPTDAHSSSPVSSSVPAHLPLIALTASAMPGDRERCLAAGMDDYVTKPFTRHQLSMLLQKWLPEKAISARLKVEKVLDAEALDHIRELEHGRKPGVLTAVIASYLEHAPQLLETLHAAVNQGDAQALRHAAHTLKSSSANLGALTLSALCKDLEAMGDRGVVTSALPLLPTLTAEYQLVREALAAELQRSA